MPEPSPQTPQPNARERQAKAVFAVMATASLIAAALLYVLRGAIGIPDDTARLISTVLVVAGVVDALVFHFWDRIFKRPGSN
jgi:uncharacterized membrane protein